MCPYRPQGCPHSSRRQPSSSAVQGGCRARSSGPDDDRGACRSSAGFLKGASERASSSRANLDERARSRRQGRQPRGARTLDGGKQPRTLPARRCPGETATHTRERWLIRTCPIWHCTGTRRRRGPTVSGRSCCPDAKHADQPPTSLSLRSTTPLHSHMLPELQEGSSTTAC